MARLRVTEDDLLAALREHGKAVPKRPPGEGWYTFEELAAKEGVSVPTIRYRFKLALENGVKIEQGTGSAPNGDGKLKRAIFYRVRK